MSKVVIGKLDCLVHDLRFTDGQLVVSALCISPQNKWIPQEGPDVPWALYGDDGSLVCVGRMSADDFDEARRYLHGGDLWLVLPLQFTTEFRPT